jgi:prolyl-tRNA synthetase
LSALQDKAIWERTDRWSDDKVDNWFKTTFKSGGETGLGITHEEPLTNIMTEYVSSYRDLPVYAYQFQNKFRNETRAKSGIMRGKEFLMKDLYSFSKDEIEHQAFYDLVREAYIKIFQRVGIGEITYVTFASGGIFSKYSEEFQTVSEAGEDIIYLDESSGKALNKEVFTDDVLSDLGLERNELVEKKSIEVGNIFHLGTKFSEPLGLTYKDEKGEEKPVIMGSYGLGPTRLMGTIVEVLSDENGMVWPEAIAPFRVHLLTLGEDERIKTLGEEVYKTLLNEGVEVLFDDRDARPGEKFADSDLIGIPHRIMIGNKTLESGLLEVKDRATGETSFKTLEHILSEYRS